MRRQTLLFALLLSACGTTDSAPTGPDSDAATADASRLDAATAGDGGAPDMDAMTPVVDSGTDTGSDAATPDAGGSGLADPNADGSMASTMSSATVHDAIGDIALTIVRPNGLGPFPVVLFLHGFQLSPSDYTSYGERLASFGYVVVMPHFPGSLFSSPTHAELLTATQHLLDWLESANAAGGALEGAVDLSAIGIAGHSMGGKISYLTASADARIKAIFGVDAVDAGGGPLGGSATDYPSVAPERMGDIHVPFVSLGETTNGSGGGFGMACAPSDQNFEQYFAAAASPALKVDVLGASHMSFLDNPSCGFTCSACPSGTDDPATSRALAQKYMVAFFERTLRHDERYARWLTGADMAADVSAGLVTRETSHGF